MQKYIYIDIYIVSSIYLMHSDYWVVFILFKWLNEFFLLGKLKFLKHMKKILDKEIGIYKQI